MEPNFILSINAIRDVIVFFLWVQPRVLRHLIIKYLIGYISYAITIARGEIPYQWLGGKNLKSLTFLFSRDQNKESNFELFNFVPFNFYFDQIIKKIGVNFNFFSQSSFRYYIMCNNLVIAWDSNAI